MSRILEEILARMVQWFTTLTDKVSDFSVGSTIRALFEALALELEELYIHVQHELQQTIRDSIYAIFGITKGEATPARTELLFTLEAGHPQLTIPKGFAVATEDGLTFTTTIDVDVPPEETEVIIPAVCTIRGYIGNVPANTITKLVSSSPYILSVTNPTWSFGGVDEESESKRRQRFERYLYFLKRGTKDAITYALLTTPGISYVAIDEPFPGCVYVYTFSEEHLTEDTLKEIQSLLDDVRAAGIQVILIPVAKVLLDVTATVEVQGSVDTGMLASQVKTIIENYLNSRQAGEDFFPAHLIGTIVAIDPVSIRNVTITPSQRIQIPNSQILRAGTVTVSVQEVTDSD